MFIATNYIYILAKEFKTNLLINLYVQVYRGLHRRIVKYVKFKKINKKIREDLFTKKTLL